MITPYSNQILVQPEEKKQLLAGDIPSLSEYGTVIAVGSEVKHFKVGDKIIFLLWGVNHIEKDGKKIYFIQENPEYILGKIEDE